MKYVRVRKNNWICDIFWVYYWYLMGSNEIRLYGKILGESIEVQ